jgi:hypothetical protein
MQYVAIVAVVFIMVTSLVAGGIAGRKGFEKATDRNTGISKVSSDEFQTADLNKIQRDDRQGQVEVAVAIAEVALSAQSIAAPGVSPNPLKIGFSDGMTIGSYVASVADRVGSDPSAGAQGAPSNAAPAGDAGPKPLPGDSGVDVATAPDDYYVGWYFTYEGRRYIKVTTVADFQKVSTVEQVMGFGYPEDPVKKVALTKASWSQADPTFLIGDNVTSWSEDAGERGILGGVEYYFSLSMNIPQKYR